MTKLQDLMYSLITIIIRYHDSQSGVQKIIIESNPQLLQIKSRELAIKVLNLRTKEMNAFLTDSIGECTKNYPARKPFLDYLLSEIQFLASLYTRDQSFSNDELAHHTKKISRMLFDFKKLLNTNKGITYKVELNPIQKSPNESVCEISLSGLKNDGYLVNALCQSGLLLKEEVMDRFNISLDTDNDYHHFFATSLCNEYQNALLVPELKKNNSTLNTQLIEKTNTCQQIEGQLSLAINDIVTLKSQAKQFEATIQQLQQKLKDSEEQLVVSKGIISSQKKMILGFPASFYKNSFFNSKKIITNQPDSPDDTHDPSPIHYEN